VGSNSRCAAITRTGKRCKAEATHGSYCWSHAPETASARKSRAAKGGRAGGNGRPSRSGTRAAETRKIRADLLRMAALVEERALDRGAASVSGRLLNYTLGAIRTEQKAVELDDVLPRLEALEKRIGEGGAQRWG
jgi:hypothetical protein